MVCPQDRPSGKPKPWVVWMIYVTLLILAVFFAVPCPHFDAPDSTVVLSAEGELLGARIAADGQWRFPGELSRGHRLPECYEKALLCYEDRCFYLHPGINPYAIGRAAWLWLKHGEILSGGSTLTMQVARLSRQQPERTLPGKFLEMLMAVKLEILHSKNYILHLYASNAPFGGNVIGLEAACWRYFQHSPEQLSWAEAATLAILPNAPAQLYPGRHPELLKEKRDRLLAQLYRRGKINLMEYELALNEELPDAPGPLPQPMPHFRDYVQKHHSGERIQTSIRYALQEKGQRIADEHARQLQESGIPNLAAVIHEVGSGEPLLYIGNSKPFMNQGHANQVDIVQSPRSSGSILKPFLYAAMLHEGEILPDALVADIPINIGGYMPQNYDYDYNGAVPASQALSRSLNIPAVKMLGLFGGERFMDYLKVLGFSTLQYSYEHYGLSLILGGGETSLWELAQAYASLARMDAVFSPSAEWFTLQALTEVSRPEGRSGWRQYDSSRRIAWKTGTSFGLRDAWAIGITPDYVVAVWAGDAYGSGCPSLSGTSTAAPLMFDLFDLLPKSERWFSSPDQDMEYARICVESGCLAGSYCPHTELRPIPRQGLRTEICPYHHLIHLSEDRLWQVSSACYPIEKMQHDSLFVLPPAMEWYYRKKHPEYQTLPPYHPDCADQNRAVIELVSPTQWDNLYLPVELDGSRGKIVIQAAHRHSNSTLYWHLDDEYIGATDGIHQMAVSPDFGDHLLLLTDEEGNRYEQVFHIVSQDAQSAAISD